MPEDIRTPIFAKVSFFGQCSKKQLIPFQSFIIKTCFIQFCWFFRLKCWSDDNQNSLLSLPNVYKLICFDKISMEIEMINFWSGIIGHCTDQRNLLYLGFGTHHSITELTLDYVYNSTHSSSRNSRGAIKTKDKSFAHTCYALGGTPPRLLEISEKNWST